MSVGSLDANLVPNHPKHPTNHLAPYQWKPGQPGGGQKLGATQGARWRKAINACTTEQDMVDVITAMKEAACGVLVEATSPKTGEISVYKRPPDVAAAALYFKVHGVINSAATDDSDILRLVKQTLAQMLAEAEADPALPAMNGGAK